MERVGFIGFGEVASRFATAVRGVGAHVLAYDVLLETPGGLDALTQRAAGSAEFVPLAQLIDQSHLILSTVTTDVALQAAHTCVPHLAPHHVYVDLNATSPDLKCEIGRVIAGSGARFVEGAILGAVGVTGPTTRILVCGEGAAGVAATMRGFGLNVADYGVEIGRASTFKLLRSVFSKGLEALLLEAMLAARRAGVYEDVWREIVASIEEKPFSKVASNWMVTHATAHERRYHEMVQVEALLRTLACDPLMTSATTAFFERSTQLGLARSPLAKPAQPADVVGALDAVICARSGASARAA